ncbi:YadA C-terminal domain-containing protein [Pasteurella multocida]|uniref:YadA C-terminal domain-containing protein n=1 Tax=Pasteurella multocida TaxID=747 RepID=UPI000F6F90DF|nr:YadA C-terminal domain-containing protein [Pasteurella multocida]VEJ14369.1 adhesion A [Pasteurella multocida subsp. septica]
MNLSKIATGIVASFCLVSNVVSASNLSLNDKLMRRLGEALHQGKNEEVKAINDIFSAEGVVDEEDLMAYMSKPNYSIASLLNDEVNKEVNNLEFKVNANKASILKNKKNIETNTRSIHENRGRIDINTKSIMENRGIITESSKEISDNRELIGKNIQDIYKNKEMMMGIADKNAKAISANSKMIEEMRSSFNTRLNHLKRDLKRGLATQSALNGLFQPYSVGKFNLTAAFGGYQSQTAIAIGTGYRFNERIAAKAGIAKSVKGAALSYNVGVNYEF